MTTGNNSSEKMDNQTEIPKQDNAKVKENITDNPNAPMLYRNKFILVYGVLFSVLAGGILMAINFSRLEKRKFILPVILFSVAYTGLQIILLDKVKMGTGLTLVVSFAGMFLIELIFWKNNIPADIEFRKRPVLGAVLIALAIATPFIVLNIMALKYQ